MLSLEANFLAVPVVFHEGAFLTFLALGVGAILGLAGIFMAGDDSPT